METSSYHSNQSSWTKTIKNTNIVQANVISMYAKFQLQPDNGKCQFPLFLHTSQWKLQVAIATRVLIRSK